MKRIIPCLDVKDGRVVKGVNFVNFKDVGDPVACAAEYEKQGADEIVFLDITATVDGRATIVDLARETARSISVPLTVGGGIRVVDDFRALFNAGAAKVSVNSAAVENPMLIKEASREFGAGRVVLAIDGKQVRGALDGDGAEYHVIVSGGQVDTGLDLIEWARQGAELGAGEILLTSVDTDGVRGGFDIPMTRAVCDAASIPVTASGGGGSLTSFIEVFEQTSAAAALGASVFHFGELTVRDVKEGLRARGIPVRL